MTEGEARMELQKAHDELNEHQQFGRITHPDWDEHDRVHNWRNYISEMVRAIWHTFTTQQQIALYLQAEDLAGKEEWE